MIPSRIRRRPRYQCPDCHTVIWAEMRLGCICYRCACYISWPRQRRRDTGTMVQARPASSAWVRVS